MQRIMIVCCLLFIVLPLFTEGRSEEGFTAREIDETKEVNKKGTINIDNVSGRVIIKSWDKDRVRVTGKIGEDVKDFQFTRTGSKTTIKVVLPLYGKKWHPSYSADLEITVPEESDLFISTISASIDIEGMKGEVEAATVSGGISITDNKADNMVLKTVSGGITVRGESRSIEASTVSGSLLIKGTTEDLRGTSVSGSLTYKDGTADDVFLKTTSGSIYLDCELADRSRIDLNSLSGNVTLVLAPGVDAKFSLKSFSGSLDYADFIDESDIGHNEISSSNNGNKKVSFESGTGKSRISAESFSGSVLLDVR